MKIRGLLAAAALLALLAGGVYWSNQAKEAEAKKPAPDVSPKLTEIVETDIKQVEIKRKDGETTLIVRAGDAWKITSPTAFAADRDAVSSFVTSAGSLSSDQVVEEKAAQFDVFGLSEPSLTAAITKKDGKTVKVLIGDETPTGSGSYARLDGDPRVFTIASYAKSGIDKKASDLRDKRLLTFDQDKLARVELTAKKTTAEFGKNAKNEWQIVKPQPYRADGWQVDELIRRLRDAKLDPALADSDAKKNAASFGSAAVIAVARMTDSAGTQTLEVRKTRDNKYLARSSAVEGIHSLPNEAAEGLDKSADDFRNKKLFDFGFSDPTQVNYKDPQRTLALNKSGENWSHGGKKMDSVAVQSFIDRLRDLQATKFATAGFTTPEVELAVVSGDGKRTEKIAIAKAKENYLARREGEPSLYELSRTAVDELKNGAAGVKEPPPPTKEEKKK
jgi:hypothetical protein